MTTPAFTATQLQTWAANVSKQTRIAAMDYPTRSKNINPVARSILKARVVEAQVHAANLYAAARKEMGVES